MKHAKTHKTNLLDQHTGRTSFIIPTDSSPALCTLTNMSGINQGPSVSPPTTKLNVDKCVWKNKTAFQIFADKLNPIK
jgi:hypothetical protein